MRYIKYISLIYCIGCSHSLAPDQFCKEVGYAIAGRTQECTGDNSLSEARYQLFVEQYTCIEYEVKKDSDSTFPYQDLYHCPLAIRNLPCELVEQYGDTLSEWMTASPTCELLATPEGP